MGFFHENPLTVASRFKKESMKMSFQKNITDPRKSKCVYNSPIIRFLFHTKIGSPPQKFSIKIP